MINEFKNDRESWYREKTILSLIANRYLKKDKLVLVAETGLFYKIIDHQEDGTIPLNNGYFAKQLGNSINSPSAERLKTPRKISIKGNAEGETYFDGSADVDINLNITEVNANVIKGIIPVENIPPAALNVLVFVKNDTERFSLTKDRVQNGDSVKVEDTLKMYKVIDDNNLNNDNGYTEYSSGRASEVPWEGITNKPQTFIPSPHIHNKNDISDFPESLKNPNKIKFNINNNKYEYDGTSELILDINIDTLNAANQIHTHNTDDIKLNKYESQNIVEKLPIKDTDNLTNALKKIENSVKENVDVIYEYSDQPPVDTRKIWVDQNDPYDNNIPDNELYKNIVKTVNDLKKEVDDTLYSLKYVLDGGERLLPTKETLLEEHQLEGYPDLPQDYTPQTPQEINGIIQHICVARGQKEAMGNLFPSEFFFDIYTKELFIGSANGKPILIGKEGGVGGSNNLTGEFLELTSPKGEAYKLKITNQGKLEIIKSAIDKQPLPNPIEPDENGTFHENWDNYKDSNNYGLCINQIYSGGPMNSDNTPVSHSFIEIYNQSERDISLRGLSVQYTKIGKDWKVCPLDGILPGNTSYLIRCIQNTNPYKLACRVKINKYDLDWNQELSPTGMKVALVVGTEPLDTENPYRDPKNGSPSIYRYIDMLCAAGKEPEQKIDYQEGYFARHCLDKNTSCCRMFRVAKKDADDNLLDTMAVDYRYADIEMYGPRCREDGPWDIYRDKIKLPANRPSMIFITFGKHQTTRIFTWQCKPTRESYLKIREKGTDKWITYKAKLRNISHHDTAASSCTVQVDNLKHNKTYQYKCGKEGEWSDEYEFETFDALYGDFTTPETETSKFTDRELKILHTTDQQGWSGEEYLAWEYAHDYIYKHEKTDFLERGEKPNYEWRFNTGDASQNGNRSFEWRYYYESAKIDLPNTVEMLIIGNNDLVDKKKSEAYTYYSNYEESPYPGCYEFFIGDVHFLSYNTWAGVDTDYTDLDGQVGYTKRQIEWLKEKLRGPRKRWTIILTHVAPYTIVQQKQGQPYKEALEGNNGEYAPVDLVICGHNHAYSRSQPMLHDKVDKLNGYYNVMCQATGYKLSGKERPDPAGKPYYGLKPDGSYAVGVPGAPTYIMWRITKDFIQFKAYIIKNIVKKDPVTKEVTYGEFQEYERELIDEFTFYHRSVRSQHLDEL